MTVRISKSGVRVADDHRDNLIIDRDDPVFARMRAGKRRHLRSENSEDALTWNVFRSLRRITSDVWLPGLFDAAFPGASRSIATGATVSLWQQVEPPPALLRDGDEGASEIDVILETDRVVWFLEAKLTSDISPRTTVRANRNQVLRNIDVGSHYAGSRDFYFSLLVADRQRSKAGADTIDAYRDLELPRRLLAAHRPDGLRNLAGVSLLTWQDLFAVLASAAAMAPDATEREVAARAATWMAARGIGSAEAE
jgi:hypothetical protein